MPENENNQTPKKKKGFLRIVIIVLIVVLAAVIGGYALSEYYGMPSWLSGLLPSHEVSVPAETLAPAAETAERAEPEASPEPSAKPEPSPEPEESAEPVATEAPAEPEEPAVTAVPYIGADAAAEAALKHSKAAQKDADFSSVLLIEQNGMMLYEARFTVKDIQYEYYIDAQSGRVESWRKTSTAPAPAEETVAASAEAKPEPSPTVTAEPEKNATVLIGEDEAKKLAMGHANISDAELSSISCKLELEGLNLVYNVDMKTKLMEYDYEIDAISGEIVGFDIEPVKK